MSRLYLFCVVLFWNGLTSNTSSIEYSNYKRPIQNATCNILWYTGYYKQTWRENKILGGEVSFNYFLFYYTVLITSLKVLPSIQR